VDFAAVADELYGLLPSEFIAARNDAVKRASAEGDRPLAAQLRSLRRPSIAAWLSNQLVREHRDEMEPLLELGRELREVMSDLGAEDLRELTQQRYRLVAALVRQARALGATRGVRLTDAVSQALRSTLEATLSDPASAQAVAAGRLADALSVSGFGQADAAAELFAPQSSHQVAEGATVSDLATKRQDKARQRAQREVAEAERAARTAQAERGDTDSRLKSVSELRARAAAVVDQLRQQLTQAEAELESQADLEEAARLERDAKARVSEEAARQLAAAREQLERLSPR